MAFLYKPNSIIDPKPDIADTDQEIAPLYQPTVAIIGPAYNEPDIANTMMSCLAAQYPYHKLKVVVVEDKSTDDTLAQAIFVAAAYR